MRLLDTDNDGTVDLDEAKKSASTLFDKLDRDHEGTLDRRELRRRLSADRDNDGTLDEKELCSRAGQALLRLLQ
jgi:Ca2+-binding EF-hand superfamily protein